MFAVKSDDALNVRAEPDSASKKVYSYAPGVKKIASTGRSIEQRGTLWTEVSFAGGTGWVNRLFLTEMKPGGGCGDPVLTAVIRKFMRAVATKDGASLEEVVSPLRGLSIRNSPLQSSVKLTRDDAKTLFTSSEPRQWGFEPGSEVKVSGPFKNALLPSLARSVAGKGAREKCGDALLMGGSAGMVSWPPELSGLTLVSFHFPGQNPGDTTWSTWVAGLEYEDAKPYVSYLIQYRWES